MSEHAHFSPDQTGICAHCGQPLPAEREPRYGRARVNGPGIAITALLHLLLVLLYAFWPKHEKQAAPPAGEAITYIAPLPGKPKKKELAAAPAKPVKRRPEVVLIERLPDTITVPQEKRIPPPEPEPPKPAVDTSVDMSDMIAARRRARGQDSEQQSGEESEKERGVRTALANIAAANNKGRDQSGREDATVSVMDKSFSHARIKFNGYSFRFKRRWLQQFDVELGMERDIETASVKKLISIMRQYSQTDIQWTSERLGKEVKLSVRPQDQAGLEEFLFQEMFPGYTPPRTR